MARRQQAADRAIRPKLRSPGHPKFQRHVEVAFWEQIAKGLLAEEAAAVVGVAQKDQAEYRHRIFGSGELGVCPQLVGGFPEFVFELLDVHSIGLFVAFGACHHRQPRPRTARRARFVVEQFGTLQT